MSSSKNIWKYIDKHNKKIINKNAIIKIWNENTPEPYELMDVAQLSPEGRQLVRDWAESSYKKFQKERPDSFFAKMAKDRVEREIEKGLDPHDQWYRVSQKSTEGGVFMRMLTAFLRAFAM